VSANTTLFRVRYFALGELEPAIFRKILQFTGKLPVRARWDNQQSAFIFTFASPTYEGSGFFESGLRRFFARV